MRQLRGGRLRLDDGTVLEPGTLVVYHYRNPQGDPAGGHCLAIVDRYSPPWVIIRPVGARAWDTRACFPEALEAGPEVTAMHVAFKMGVQPREWDDYDL